MTTYGITIAAITPVSWGSLPSPLREKCTMKAGTNQRVRNTQSGRKEIRSFGSGAPDAWDFTWLLTAAEHDSFRTFWETTSALGTKWATADWLTELGYGAGYVVRLLGYPRESMHRYSTSGGYTEYSCAGLVMLQANLYDVTYVET